MALYSITIPPANPYTLSVTAKDVKEAKQKFVATLLKNKHTSEQWESIIKQFVSLKEVHQEGIAQCSY